MSIDAPKILEPVVIQESPKVIRIKKPKKVAPTANLRVIVNWKKTHLYIKSYLTLKNRMYSIYNNHVMYKEYFL